MVKRYSLKLQVKRALTVEHFSHIRINEHVITAENDFQALGRVHEILSMERAMTNSLSVTIVSFQLIIGGYNSGNEIDITEKEIENLKRYKEAVEKWLEMAGSLTISQNHEINREFEKLIISVKKTVDRFGFKKTVDNSWDRKTLYDFICDEILSKYKTYKKND